MSSNERDHPRTRLNNELQLIYGSDAAKHVRWEDFARGPPNNLTWYSTVYIDDMKYGDGTARTKDDAKDKAADKACNDLRRERLGQ
ncbi:hypothetical protein DEU56DRAFT_49703 [Suillus clintonianus]|uniref:uncharacterized protein n=1 Tax=Suillus clintonianus TaxID=1904413 RepID=UPI001B86C6CE|nr:uncharacterized protein DEU56DRAFT_49703 [Suillus clintonianus]KAG2123482.1 hypothetical protein DEU56DRAFT_49703 [Suillus clintonianus]